MAETLTYLISTSAQRLQKVGGQDALFQQTAANFRQRRLWTLTFQFCI